jgi:HK97 family phage major capsid protein|nr:MAG TPA: major capsid protein [Caudoviricetes sp.]
MNLEQLLQQTKEKRAALYESIKTAATMEEMDKIELDIRKAEIEIKNLEEQISTRGLSDEGNDPAARDNGGENLEKRGLNPLGTYGRGVDSISQGEEEDMYGSLEYRQAFRNYIVSGTPIPEKFRREERSAELTIVSDVAAVIPTTIMNKVIEDLTVEGKIINKITQTQYQGGVAIPISEVMPEATWLSDENTQSDEQKAKMQAKLTFGYHVLEAKVAVGLLTATVSLPVFEQTIVKQIKKAMIRAIEKAIVNGSGSGQPLGILKVQGIPAKNIVTFNADEVDTVKGWARAEAAVDEAYDNENLVYLMSKQTWEMHLNSMVDTTGQKIGLGKIDEKGRKILNGREVITTDQFLSYENTDANGIFGCLVNLEQYLLNSNLAMYYKKYFNEDTNKWIHKCLMIADGKMAMGKDSKNKLVGAGGLIYLKKVIS